MTSPKADSDSPAPLEDGGLDEERITTALLRLQEMHLQLRNLRQNIRLIVQPLHTEYSSPQALYAAFSQNANGAVNNVRGFTKLLEDSESQNALSRARESREKDNGGIMGWLVTQHEDWLDDVGEKGEKTGGDQVNNTDRTGADGEKEEDVTAILGKFQEEHSDVQVERQEGGSAIKVESLITSILRLV
ncbi:hypothetical protein MMC20_002161 [Loxospora ochrophaea]|nr:hypothetical protein [Loxospora ochrophaea]